MFSSETPIHCPVILMCGIILDRIHTLVYAKTDAEKLAELDRLARPGLHGKVRRSTIKHDLLTEAVAIIASAHRKPKDIVTINRMASAVSGMIHDASLEKTPNGKLKKLDAIVQVLAEEVHLGASMAEIAFERGGDRRAMSRSTIRLVNSHCYRNSPKY